MNYHGWEKLICHYFYSVCMDVLSDYFSEFGFESKITKIGGVTFRKHDIFVEVSYNPETYPSYSLSVVIGIGSGAYNDCGKFSGLPIWSVIPTDDRASEFSLWKFSNENELEEILIKTKVMVLEPIAKPLWEDQVRLEGEIKRFVKV